MALTDHKAPIIDLVFSADDSKVFTSAADGTVYSWFTFGSSRDGEFIAKGSTAMKIAVSCQSGPEGYIISSFLPSDHANHHANTTMGKKMARNMHSSDFRKRQQDHGASRGGDTGKRFSVGTGPNASAMQGARLKSPLDGTSADEGGKNFLVVWRGNVSSSGEVVMLDAPLTALTFGRMDGHSAHRDEFVVMGFADGRVVVSMLPLPLRVFNSKATIHSTHISSHFNHQNDSDVIIAGVAAGGASMGFASTSGPPSIDGGPSRADADPHSSHGRGPMGSFTGNGNGGDGIANGDEERVLDLTQCAKLHLHETEVTEVAVAASGYWFFTAGADGVVFMMSTSMRARDFYDVPEALALENSFVVTEKSNLQALRSRMDDVDTIITEAFRDNERKMNKLKEQMTTTVATLENRMKREVQKRDDIILRGRDEHAKQQRMLNEEKRTVEKKLTDEIVELESIYERKLTQVQALVGPPKFNRSHFAHAYALAQRSDQISQTAQHIFSPPCLLVLLFHRSPCISIACAKPLTKLSCIRAWTSRTSRPRRRCVSSSSRNCSRRHCKKGKNKRPSCWRMSTTSNSEMTRFSRQWKIPRKPRGVLQRTRILTLRCPVNGSISCFYKH